MINMLLSEYILLTAKWKKYALKCKKNIIFSTANRGLSCAYIYYTSNETCFYTKTHALLITKQLYVRNLNRIGNS